MSQLCLVADDSLYARMMLKNAVSESMPEAMFQEASSGRQALELAAAEQYRFDWYLLDVNMAPPDGLATARSLVQAGVPIGRIALVTGNRSSHLIEDADLMGICLINKAVSPDDVPGFVGRLSNFFAGQTAE
ncbi:response regulator transcription factor [Parathalassolituus penaei]|uniref:Response regulator n=1 Tax=Parathalassolituus penaei TaxID=2997323 RepID=A0A9X3IV44_9GAMM|nr:response regulator [Parathalassolituus penaei]MCY0966863.1 response regulator [Parathalassolituus penaei]